MPHWLKRTKWIWSWKLLTALFALWYLIADFSSITVYSIVPCDVGWLVQLICLLYLINKLSAHFGLTPDFLIGLSISTIHSCFRSSTIMLFQPQITTQQNRKCLTLKWHLALVSFRIKIHTLLQSIAFVF